MTIASINESLSAYMIEKNTLTSSVASIMFKLTRASADGLDIMNEVSAQKQALQEAVAANPEYATTTEYQVLMDQINDDYELQMAEIDNWELELQTDKNNKETQIKEIDTFMESYQQVLKSNIKRDFTYGQTK